MLRAAPDRFFAVQNAAQHAQTYSVDESSVMRVAVRRWLLARNPDRAWREAMRDVVKRSYFTTLAPTLQAWRTAFKADADIKQLFRERGLTTNEPIATLDKLLAGGTVGREKMLELCGTDQPKPKAKSRSGGKKRAAAAAPAARYASEPDDDGEEDESDAGDTAADGAFVDRMRGWQSALDSHARTHTHTHTWLTMLARADDALRRAAGIVRNSPPPSPPPERRFATVSETAEMLREQQRQHADMMRQMMQMHETMMRSLAGAGGVAPATHNVNKSSNANTSSGKECFVCLEVMGDASADTAQVVAKCGHSYCHQCHLRLLSDRGQYGRGDYPCPMCRKPVSEVIKMHGN